MKPTRTLLTTLVLSTTVAVLGCDQKVKQDPDAEFNGPDREKRIKMMEKNAQKAKQDQKR